jgi:hypothetical protein
MRIGPVTKTNERNEMRARIAAAVLAAALLTVLALAASAMATSQATHPKLLGVVGNNDAFKISLTSKGKSVKTLKADTYTLVIQDDSTIHNYELDGPHGKSWTFTSVGFKGTKTFTLKLVKGKYKAYCSPHESIMFQRFAVV